MKGFLNILTVFFIFLGSIQINGQSEISGFLKDNNREPIPYANVLLLNVGDSIMIKGAMTDETGQYVFDRIISGNYMLSFSSVGFENKFSKPFKIASTGTFKKIEPFFLEEEVESLDEVYVYSKKQLFEKKSDRLIVNVQSGVSLSGGTALDVLERSPGILINRQNNSIGINGKNGVSVTINGKNSRMPRDAVVDMLSSMNASNIEKIELITTPPANFDAEGGAGIINIVLKKNDDYGTNGSYSIIGGYGRGEKLGANANLNHRNEKLNYFGGYSFFYDDTYQESSNQRNVDNAQQFESKNISRRYAQSKNHSANFGFDYGVSERTIIGAIFDGSSYRWEMDAFNDINIKSQNQNTIIKVDNEETNHWYNFGANFNVQHSFRENNTLTFNFDYLYYHDLNPSSYVNRFFNQSVFESTTEARAKKVTPINILITQMDYTKKIGESANLELGLKNTNSRLKNNVSLEDLVQKMWVSDTSFTRDFNLNENINAAYASLQLILNETTSLKTGLRWEHTISDLTSKQEGRLVERNLHSFFPSIVLSIQNKNKSSIQLTYNRRITRPNYNDLAPFFLFVDPNTIFTGNTALAPAFTDAFKLDYLTKENLSISLEYNYDKNSIAEYQPHLTVVNNQLVNFAENIRNRNTYTLTFSAPLKVNSWWETQTNILSTYQKINASFETIKISKDLFSFRVNSTHTFNLPKNFSAEFSVFYNSATLQGILKRKPYGSLDLGLQKRLPKDKGTLRLSLSDVFWTNTWQVSYNEPSLDLRGESGFKFEPSVVRLTFIKNFGNNKLKTFGKKSKKTEDIKKRVGN